MNTPDWIAFDENTQTLFIKGKRYAVGLFGKDGFLSPPGTVLRIVENTCHTITCETLYSPPVNQIDPYLDLKEAQMLGAQIQFLDDDGDWVDCDDVQFYFPPERYRVGCLKETGVFINFLARAEIIN